MAELDDSLPDTGAQACDACGRDLAADEARFTVAIEVFAPGDTLEIDEAEIERDRTSELIALAHQLEGLDPDEAQDDVHRAFRYTLCRPCQRIYLSQPLAPPWPTD